MRCSFAGNSRIREPLWLFKHPCTSGWSGGVEHPGITSKQVALNGGLTFLPLKSTGWTITPGAISSTMDKFNFGCISLSACNISCFLFGFTSKAFPIHYCFGVSKIINNILHDTVYDFCATPCHQAEV